MTTLNETSPETEKLRIPLEIKSKILKIFGPAILLGAAMSVVLGIIFTAFFGLAAGIITACVVFASIIIATGVTLLVILEMMGNGLLPIPPVG